MPARRPPPGELLLEHVARVPRDERLDDVRVADDAGGDEHRQGHGLEVVDRDDAVQLQEPPHGDHQRQDHRQARVDGPGHEVRGEDRRVPARAGCAMAKSHDTTEWTETTSGVARAAKKRYAAPVVPPLAARAGPAEREPAVEPRPRDGPAPGAAPHRSRAAARSGIRPTNQKIELTVKYVLDGAHVPDERAEEVGPELPLATGTG